MKMRTVFRLLIVLFLVLTFNTIPSFAQEPPEMQPLEHPALVTRLIYSFDSAMIATGCQDGKVRLWDVETGTIRHTLEHPNVKYVYDVAFSPDGTTVASASDDWKVRLWDVETGTIRRTLIGHDADVFGVAFSPDGTTFASADHHTVRIWDASTDLLLHTIPSTGHTRLPYNRLKSNEAYIVYSPDGATLASPNGNTLYLIDVATGTLRDSLKPTSGRTDFTITDVEYSPEGSTLATGGLYVYVWDVATGRLRHTLEGDARSIASVAYSPDGRTLISGGPNNAVRVWDMATGAPIDVLPPLSHILGVAYSPDDTTFATGYGNNELHLWDAATRTRLYRLNPQYGDPHRVTYSPDGTTLAAIYLRLAALYRFTPPPPIIFTPSEVVDQTFTVGTPVNLTLPFATGGTVPYTYTLTPIPNGLQFDSATRELHGTPRTPMDATPVTYTATDTTGASASLTFTITVQNQDTPSPTDAYMYWASWDFGSIQRGKLDGTNVQDVVTGLTHPRDVALDIAGSKMYWVDATTNKVQRANLDGSNVEDLVNTQGRPFGVAVDTMGGKVYWSIWGPGKIRRANLDGTHVEDFVTGLSQPEDIDFDISAGKIYWMDTVTNKLQRANLDGSNLEDLVTVGLSHSLGLTLDVAGGKIYWTNTSFWPGPWPGHDKIQRANLDGTHVEDLLTVSGVAGGIALDVSAGKMYWAESGKIWRANLDGSNVEEAIVGSDAVPIAPTGIALGIPQTPGLRLNPNVIADRTFTVGTAVSLRLPTAIGGTPPHVYSLTPSLPAGLYFDSIANRPGYIGGTPTAAMPPTPFTYTATDATGAFVSLTFTITVTGESDLNLDVNGDGKVDVLDLVLVAALYGTRLPGLSADVNADGVVNIQDLIAVAAGIDAADAVPLRALEQMLLAAAEQAAALEAAAGAPVIGFSSGSEAVSGLTAYRNVAAALSDVRALATSDAGLGKWVPMLEGLLQVLTEMRAIPETTALLPNYPNPFNPETWIPYHLSTDAKVTLTIYDVRGSVVRTLTLGHQPAGVYQSKYRAAYWDGRNQSGEPVASGLYFYTLSTKSTRDSSTAGDFTATRKMLIAK